MSLYPLRSHVFYVTHLKTFFWEAIRKLGQTAEGIHGTGETEGSRVRGTPGSKRDHSEVAV